jgi:hypothetical protein
MTRVFSVAKQTKSGIDAALLRFLHNTILHTHTHTHTQPGRTPAKDLSARRRGRFLHNTQQTQETDIHALSGI